MARRLDFSRLVLLSAYVGDAALIGLAGYFAFQSEGPLDQTGMLIVAGCVFAGAVLPIVVHLVHYLWERAQLAANESEAGYSLLVATDRMDKIAERVREAADTASKSTLVAKQIPERSERRWRQLSEQIQQLELDKIGTISQKLGSTAELIGVQLKTVEELALEVRSLKASLDSATTAKHELDTDVDAKSRAFEERLQSRILPVLNGLEELRQEYIAAQELAQRLDEQRLSSEREFRERLDEIRDRLNMEAIVSPSPPEAVAEVPPQTSTASVEPQPEESEEESPRVSRLTASRELAKEIERLSAGLYGSPNVEPEMAEQAPGTAEPPPGLNEEAVDPEPAGEAPGGAGERTENEIDPGTVEGLEETEEAIEEDLPEVAPEPVPATARKKLDPVEIELFPDDTADSDEERRVGRETTLIVKAMIGFSNRIFLRGDEPHLSWDQGVELELSGIGEYRWSVRDMRKPLACKVLLNDSKWARGGNIMLRPGDRITVVPEF